jgi:hypothetical protein
MRTKVDEIVEKIQKLLPRVNISAYNVYSGSSYFHYHIGPFRSKEKPQGDWDGNCLSFSASQKFKAFKENMWEHRDSYGSSVLNGFLFKKVADGKDKWNDGKRIKGLRENQHEALTERIYALPELREAFNRTRAQVKQIISQIDLKDQQYQILKKEAQASIKANAKSFDDKIPLTEICELMEDVIRELTIEGVMKA